MKEFVANTGGRKLFNDDVLALQDLAKSFESFYADEDPFIISGVELTNTGGTIYDISAGFVWLDNRIRVFNAATGVDLATDQFINAVEISSNTIYADFISRESSIDYQTVLSSTFVSTNRSITISATTPARRYLEDVLGAVLLLKDTLANSQTVNKEVVFTGQLTGQGVIENSGGINISAGGLSVADGIQVSSGDITVSNGLATFSKGAFVQEGFSIGSGGANITGDVALNQNLSVAGLATFTGGMEVDSIITPVITLQKSGSSSFINFNAETNDVGFIEHNEVSNISAMRFSSGDEGDVNDTFEFGFGAPGSHNATLVIYANGRLDVNGQEVIDANSQISWGRLKDNVSIEAGAGLTGGGSLISSRTLSIAQGGIVNSMYANGSITGSKIATDTITAGNIANGAVGNGELANGAVTTQKIANQAVGNNQLADNSVTASKIPSGAIGSAEIASGAVGSSELGTNSVTSAKIAANAVGSSEIASGAVGTSELVNRGVSLSKIQNVTQGTFLGRRSGVGTGAVELLTNSQVRSELGINIRTVALVRMNLSDMDFTSIGQNIGGVVTNIADISSNAGGVRDGVQVFHNLNSFNYTVICSPEAFISPGTNDQETASAIVESFRYQIWDKVSNSFKISFQEVFAANQQLSYIWVHIIRW